MDEVEHVRIIYSLLDVLGDIGGLSDALWLIGKLIVFLYSLASRSGLSVFLV